MSPKAEPAPIPERLEASALDSQVRSYPVAPGAWMLFED